MQGERQGEHFKGSSHVSLLLGACHVGKAHMVSDSKRLVTCKAHIARDNINRLFSVAVRKCIFYGVIRNGFPNAVLLNVSCAFNVEVGLAEVMKKRHYRDAFFAVFKSVLLFYSGTGQIVAEAVVNVNAVLAETAGVIAVLACACGSAKKVAA